MLKKFTLVILLFLCKTTFSYSQVSQQTLNDGPTEKIVKVFPNPATTQINFELQNNNNGKLYEVIVYNFLGEKFDDIKLNGKTTLNLNKYYSGIYIYQLLDMQGNVIDSGKFNVIK
jgi:Secretion system C-terminal sorting domain